MLKDDLNNIIVSVILITKNDGDIIEGRLKLIKEVLSKVNLEILVIDSNSQDETVEKIRNLKSVIPYTRILILSKEYDPEVSLTAGLDNCIGDLAILFNLYTDPPKVIPNLIYKLLEGNDIVVGKIIGEVVKQSIFTKFFLNLVEKLSTRGFYYRQNFLTGLNRKAINSITRTRRKSRNFAYIHSLIGFRKAEFMYKATSIYKQKLRKENFFDIFFPILDTIVSNSYRPIRFLVLAGIVLSALFLLFVFVIVVLVVFFNMKHLVPPGWVSISTVVGSLFFLLFSVLALISEYMIRIMNETRNEPLYFIADEINQSVILQKKKANVI